MSDVFNAKYQDLYSKVDASWTELDYEDLEIEVEKIYNVSMQPLNRSRDYYVLLDEFYDSFELKSIEEKDKLKKEKLASLQAKLQAKQDAINAAIPPSTPAPDMVQIV